MCVCLYLPYSDLHHIIIIIKIKEKKADTVQLTDDHFCVRQQLAGFLLFVVAVCVVVVVVIVK